MLCDVAVESERAAFRAPELLRGIAGASYAADLPPHIESRAHAISCSPAARSTRASQSRSGSWRASSPTSRSPMRARGRREHPAHSAEARVQ
jgi:hypothetical protein